MEKQIIYDLSKIFKEKQEENNRKNIELYKPYTYEELLNLNKIKYRNEKIKIIKKHYDDCLWNLKKIIELYKEMINRTEFWEKKSTYEFNFKDWNTLKKANGKITRYFNDLIKIKNKIEREEKK